ncbi:MAG: response regulator transcription factor [Treponema sp.]|jgi:DNA-binding NarL/FixJ family response regulator|nr:response regulator transcription factor [Treponema sp.]
MEKTSILIAARNDEDKKLITTAIAQQDELRIIGVEKDETGTIIKSEQLKPDILIMNLQQPEIDGTVLAPIIHRRSPDTSIIMMCDRDENDYAGTAIRAGISGFLLRKADMNKLLSAVKIVNMGGYYISASIIERASNSITFLKQIPDRFIDNQNHIKGNYSFSPIERCIINEIAQGLSDEEIAEHLYCSAGSVKNCVTAIKRKTKLKNRMEIVVFSLVYGLIDFEQLDLWIKKSDGQIFNNII